ncbi:unnamed protein product [Cylindrotheca closterium]|uniref:TFIIS central domain-containing protein n=1 Tax=Cylindrotheca closterium TaxID=2856 RepID=A0AAD2FBG3_9STRA|nr:unnamed protein product [Cylindrotheca closterium]
MVTLSWAENLVGRDWEIWWSDNEEGTSGDNNDDGNQDQPSGMDVDNNDSVLDDTMTGRDLVSSTVMASLDNTTDDPVDRNENNDESESEGEGSVIDDWYAGRILSFEQSGQSFIFKVIFVGDEEEYEMALDSTKVRPSAIAWIKRTKAILCSSEFPSDSELPPDTNTDLDSTALSEIEMENEQYHPTLSIPQKGRKKAETIGNEDLRRVLRMKCLLRRQIYLRTKLAKIENHAGSEKYVDGEPNPTETYVNHLVLCCNDQIEFCDWFCRCWNFLCTIFCEKSSESQSDQPRPTIDQVVATYFETGKNVIMNFLSIDVESKVSKRRQPVTYTTQSARQSKRRRKMKGGSDSYDGGPTNSIADPLLQTITNHSEAFLMSIAEEMMKTICSFVIDKALTWKHDAEVLLRLAEADKAQVLKSNEGDESGSADSKDDVTKYVTLEQIKPVIDSAIEDDVMAQLDTNPMKDSLQKKMDKVLETEVIARSLLSQIGNEDGDSTDNSDKILSSLQKISEELENSESPLRNVDPIGNSEHPISRDAIREAIQLRSWLIKVWHAGKVRERYAFIEDLSDHIAEPPGVSYLSEVTESAHLASQVADAQKQAEALVDQAKLAASKELALEDLWDSSTVNLQSIAGVEDVAASLSSNSCILMNEEKLALRKDVLSWVETAREIMSKAGEKGHDFSQLEILNQDCQEILKGRSKGLMRLLEGVHPNTKVEKELERFGSSDISSIGGPLLNEVSQFYLTALQWKQRSQSIISTLRLHGNTFAGEPMSAQKTPPMVDIKRIKDLLAEYKSLGVQLHNEFQVLEAVDKEATEWSVRLYQKLNQDSISPAECLSVLLEQRDLRPSGMIVDPVRHLFDLMVDTLTWYQRIQESVKFAETEVLGLTKNNRPQSEIDQKHSSLCVDRFYPLLVDGSEVLQLYAKTTGLGDFAANLSQQCEEILESFGLRKTSRAIQLEKLQVHPLGAAIISKMILPTDRENTISPLFVLLWYSWHLFVSDLVWRSGTGTAIAKTSQQMKAPTLESALQVLAKEPKIPSSQGQSSEALLIATKTVEITQMDGLISDATGIQEGIRNLLSQSKELLKAGFQKADLVQQHLASLKDYLASFRTQSKSSAGFALDPSLDQPLDEDIKTFSWFVRTFSYPFLFLDEASFNRPIDSRIPWNVLVSLYERHPNDPGVQVGSFALVSLRVKELYEAGTQWQEEITKFTALTNRGGRRRVPGASPAKPEQDSDASSILQMEQMGRLAKHPILAKIAMPRETAVKSILESSKEFETQLHDFLGLDYEGASPDRASFPSSDSLVGKGGEFILYRLTGSPLFEEVQTRQQSLSAVAEHVLADTRGKATFEWISNAVSWIQSLVDGVIDKSPFSDTDRRMSIPSAEAKMILQQGEEIFLELPDDLKRTLSQHGIMVTTNKQDQTIKVIVKKNGAHHSCGGTVIRWCPILFQALRADIKRLARWESSMTRTLGEFNVFFKESRNVEKDDETLYKWFSFQERVADLLESGHDELVVTPQKNFVSSFQNLLISFQKYLAEHSNQTKNLKFAMRWISESNSIIDDRFLLLDSLLYRSSLVENDDSADDASHAGDNSTFPGDSNHRTFRDSCRSYIEKALSKALKITGMSSLPDLADMDSFCAIKAWEIEGAMFERYQGDFGISKISEEYRDKARSFRWSLEAKNNASLCLRILMGELKIETLLDMSSEDLSSQKLKLKRAKAEQAAKSSTMLTKPKSPSTASDGGVKAEETQLVGSIAAVKDEVDVDTKAKDDGEKASADDSKESPSAEYKAEASETSSPVAAAAAPISEASLKAVTQAFKSYKPPPPPPSLVQSSFQSTLDDDDAGHYQPDPDVRIMNSNGGDRFHIEIVNLRQSFWAALYLEDENSNFGSNQLIPSNLMEKGRLKIEEFQRFLHDKLAGRRWAAFALRLDILSDQRAYKKFYKEYETKKRIAMFTVSQNTKVFLVTPKFHRSVQSEGLTLLNKTSSYAIVLTKETVFLD